MNFQQMSKHHKVILGYFHTACGYELMDPESRRIQTPTEYAKLTSQLAVLDYENVLSVHDDDRKWIETYACRRIRVQLFYLTKVEIMQFLIRKKGQILIIKLDLYVES